MTKSEFLKKHNDVLKKCTYMVEGSMRNRDDIDKTNFNGIYVILKNTV